MKEFISDFNIFFNGIFGALQTLWDWLFSTTVLGKVILFTILISIFIFIVWAIIEFKQS